MVTLTGRNRLELGRQRVRARRGGSCAEEELQKPGGAGPLKIKLCVHRVSKDGQQGTTEELDSSQSQSGEILVNRLFQSNRNPRKALP